MADKVITLHGGRYELHVLTCQRARLLQFEIATFSGGRVEKKLVGSAIISLSRSDLEHWFGKKLATDVMKEIG